MLFAILGEGREPSDALKDELRAHMRRVMGAVATPQDVYFVTRLPKTRSGKIMRRVLAAVASGADVGDISTLEDEASVDEVRRAYEELRKAVWPRCAPPPAGARMGGGMGRILGEVKR